MAKVTLSNKAQVDLVELLTDLGGRAGAAIATKCQGEIYHFFNHLSAFPESCQARPRLGRGIRLGVVSPYSLLYRYDSDLDHVLVIRILHGRRKITRGMVRNI